MNFINTKKIIIAIVTVIIVCLLIGAICVYATNNKIEDLRLKIDTNNEVVDQIQHTKTQLHGAAEALRNPHINDYDLASLLSNKWSEIDIKEKELMEQNAKMKQEITDLQNKYLGIFELTAYCYGNRTATGTTPTANRTIAVDPTVIPYGQKVYIEGYGTYIAEDCGGAVKGNIIDIYIPGYENCINFGRRKARVYLVE